MTRASLARSARGWCALLALLTPGVPLGAQGVRATGGAVAESRDAAARALAVLRARAEHEQASAEYARSRALHEQRMLSDAELAAKRLDAERARVGYWMEVIAAARGGARVLVERATRRRTADGHTTVRVTLRAVGRDAQPRLSPAAAGADEPAPLDDALRRALGDGALTDVFVSLKTEPGANGTTISSPYERRVARLPLGRTTTVEFRLFRDVAEVVVSVSVGDGVAERRVFLERDGGAARFAVQSTQLSQEADLGTQALFDLRIQRLGAEGATRLALDGLPTGVAAEFRDPESKARLTQIRFQEGEDERRLQLAVTLPQRAGGALRADHPFRFAVVVADAAAGAAVASDTDAVGRIALELVPRGLPRVELRAVNLYHEVAAGDSAVAELVVRNSGSRALDDLRLRADPPSGWRADFVPTAIGSLSVDAERAIRLVVRSPPDAAVGDYEARVRVESASADRRLETEDKLLRLHVADRGTPIGSAIIVALLVLMLVGVGVVGRRWVNR